LKNLDLGLAIQMPVPNPTDSWSLRGNSLSSATMSIFYYAIYDLLAQDLSTLVPSLLIREKDERLSRMKKCRSTGKYAMCAGSHNLSPAFEDNNS
jgi:hypothetical protein